MHVFEDFVLFVHEKERRDSITKDEISYQNKDITSKYLAERMTNKSLAVYGINVPKIINVLPTNLPAIKANELRIDNLFELEDGTFALVDYESDYRQENKIKYLDYIVRVLRKYEKVCGLRMRLRMIVIYTADIEEAATKNDMDIGCLNFRIEEAFLSNLKTKEILNRITKKIKRNMPLTEEEMMEFIILPLTCRGKKQKQQMIRTGFELAKSISDSDTQLFVISGMLVFSDKIISDTEAERIRRWIRMTKVGRLFLEEMNEAVRETAERVTRETTERVSKETAERVSKETEGKIARKMLERGASIEDVAEAMDVLKIGDIERLAQELGIMAVS